MMLGLLMWHEATGDPAALGRGRDGSATCFCNRFLGDKRRGWWTPARPR